MKASERKEKLARVLSSSKPRLLGPNPRRFIPFHQRATHVLKKMLDEALRGMEQINSGKRIATRKHRLGLAKKIKALEKELTTRAGGSGPEIQVLTHKVEPEFKYEIPVSARFRD